MARRRGIFFDANFYVCIVNFRYFLFLLLSIYKEFGLYLPGYAISPSVSYNTSLRSALINILCLFAFQNFGGNKCGFSFL